MTNFKYSFDSPKAISFQIQLYCFSSDMLRVTALAYRVVAFTLFAQISLFLLLNPLFTRLSLPHFGHIVFLCMTSFYTAYRILATPSAFDVCLFVDVFLHILFSEQLTKRQLLNSITAYPFVSKALAQSQNLLHFMIHSRTRQRDRKTFAQFSKRHFRVCKAQICQFL